MENEKTYWFPAKTCGWGWGLPNRWQGWVVMAVFVLMLIGGGVFLLSDPVDATGNVFVAYASLLSALLLAVCWLKGEPPGWHWGDK